jgi:hypothetical protein
MSDFHMRDVHNASRDVCPLCAYSCSDNVVFNEIIDYVSDNSHRAHINELVTHVRTALRERLQIEMTRMQVRDHFLSHQCGQTVVLNSVLRDLVDIVGVAKTNCIVCTEEGVSSMDPKNTGVYIDAVKQLMCIYKQLDNVARTK